MIFPTAVKAAHAGGGVRKSPRLSHDSPERYRQQRWSDTAAAPQTAAATLRFKNACKNSKNVATVAVTEHSASRASMVNFLGMQTEAHSVKPGQLVEMFDSSWRVRSIWDGVRLEVVEDRSPVVLHSFTHLDPDLPLLEVRRRPGEVAGTGAAGG